MITKEQFDSLSSDDITKKQYDDVIRQIDKRFGEICDKFLQNKKNGWYDYDNVSYDDEDSKGFFDPERYKEFINISGEWIDPPPGYDLSFPTRWLWEENWGEEMQKTGEDYKKLCQEQKKLTKEKLEKRKQKIETLKASIKQKLTSEELKIVEFKKI